MQTASEGPQFRTVAPSWRPKSHATPLRTARNSLTAQRLRPDEFLDHARWKIEQDYRQLKDELGLDHYEGRSWNGWHHHVTLVMLAYSFLTLETARSKKNFWVDPAEDPA